MLIAGGLLLIVFVWLFGFVCGQRTRPIRGIVFPTPAVAYRRETDDYGTCLDRRCKMCWPEG